MADVDSDERLQAALRDSIETTLNANAEGSEDFGVLISFILIADVATVDGERYMRLLGDNNLPVWNKIGMLQFSQTMINETISTGDDEEE